MVSDEDLAECQSDADNDRHDIDGDVYCSGENCDDDDNDHLDYDS